MKGVILAGGNGTRLLPLTKIINKHLLPVYDRPMIQYPLQSLIELGCNDILIVSGGEHIGDFAEYLGDGSGYGVKLTYRVQPRAGGVAQALACAEDFVDSDIFPVILGDNYFSGLVKLFTGPTIFIKAVEKPERFGVYDPKTNQIIEKPKVPVSKFAVTGLYVYDQRVFDIIRTLKPSQRGELEITDVNNRYLELGAEVCIHLEDWSDMGTFNSLLRTAANIARRSA